MWDGFPLSAEGGDNEQHEVLGQEKLKTPSHRMCDRNPTNLLADEETETQRGAANREDTSSVRPNTSNFFFYFFFFGGEELFKKRNEEFKCKMPMATTTPPKKRRT